jgi:hypothetical protein
MPNKKTRKETVFTKEEEGEIFPEARKTDIDFVALGEQMGELGWGTETGVLLPSARPRAGRAASARLRGIPKFLASLSR